MSVPALEALRQAYPKARISILARPWVAGLYGREPFCDEVIPYNAPTLRQKYRAVQDLKAGRFDCAVLLQNAFEAAAITAAARIPVRIGYNRDARGWLLTHPIPVPKSGDTLPHQRFYYLELLKRANLTSSYDLEKPIRLAGAEAAAVEGRRHFVATGINGPVIGVSPGAAYGGAKRWLPERFAETANSLASELNATVAIFGSHQEVDVCQAVASRIEGPVVNFAGRTPLDRFIEMAAACEVYLTNDSGPMHIASALGVPTVAVFGATDHIATGPTGGSTRVIREAVDCSPCLKRECPIDHRCMTRVEARQVAQAALDLVSITKGK